MIKNRTIRIFAILLVLSNILSVMFLNCSEQGGFEARDPLGGDPLTPFAWHLHNYGQVVYAKKSASAGIDMNLLRSWSEGYTGAGVTVMISDTGLEDTHEDLHDNFIYNAGSKDYTLSSPYFSRSSAPKSSEDNHGTSVAGIVAGRAGNGKGSRGVAPKASLLSSNLLSADVNINSYSMIIDQLEGDFDILNMSWGATQNLVDDDYDGHNSDYEAQLKNLVTTKRNGRGTIFVKAAGNDFVVDCYSNPEDVCIGNSNFDRDNANPYSIIVSALDSSGSSAVYSSPGSNIWISSFGGSFGEDSPAMVTTDRTGCLVGEATTGANSALVFEKGQLQNKNCNYTLLFNGTSSSAPSVSGAIALMLEANPKLTWRDVKYILAKTARSGSKTSPINHPLKKTYPMPSGYGWEQGWVTNKAGFKFHNWFGFGVINVDEAVFMAKNYSSKLDPYHETSWFTSSAINSAIPDFSAAGVTHSISAPVNVKIEGVRIKVKINHSNISHLGLELTSPAGTKSIIVNAANSMTGVVNYVGSEVFLSNAFYGESSSGTWTLKVIDAVSGSTGSLKEWSINFVGGQ